MTKLQERLTVTTRGLLDPARRGRVGSKLSNREDQFSYSVPETAGAETAATVVYAPTPTLVEERYALRHREVMRPSRLAESVFARAVQQFENTRQDKTGSFMPGKRIARLWTAARIRSDAIKVRSSLESERSELSFDPLACRILGRIYDVGHASRGDLEAWIETTDEWIAFSRLQRARLVFDSGSEFTVSREGREFVQRMLGGAQ